jgi:hypothetical protein
VTGVPWVKFQLITPVLLVTLIQLSVLEIVKLEALAFEEPFMMVVSSSIINSVLGAQAVSSIAKKKKENKVLPCFWSFVEDTLKLRGLL